MSTEPIIENRTESGTITKNETEQNNTQEINIENIINDSNEINDIADKIIEELLNKRMYILTTKSLNKNDNINQKILCDIVKKVEPKYCKKSKGGSKKKRTVTIKSNSLPKTVKGLKTRKKELKDKIKKAEKKVQLNKDRIIRLK